MTEKHLARRAGRSAVPAPHRVVSAGPCRGPPLLSPRAVPCPPPGPQPQATPKHTWNQISSFSSIFHTPQLFHKIFLFYIFYTNVTKRWEGREADRQCIFMPINGWWGDGGPGRTENAVSMGIPSRDSKTWWGKEASETRGVYRVYSRERWRCGGDASCYVTCQGGKGRGREQCLRKEPNSARRLRSVGSRGF